MQGGGGHVRCMCSNARDLGAKQEAAEIKVQSQTCDIIGITEMVRGQLIKLECSYGQIQVFQGKQAGKIRGGDGGGGVALYAKKQVLYMELSYRTDDKLVESLWSRIKEASKSDIMVGVCCRPHEQDKEADEIYFKQQEEVSLDHSP